MKEKIVISIAAYRELELEKTVKSFYSNAKYPDRLLFSIVSQDHEDIDLSYISPKNLSYVRTSPDKSRGVSWARSLAAAAFSRYDYFFQIDGHMMASPEWDIHLIDTYKQIQKSENSDIVLAAYPAPYTLGDNRERVISPGVENVAPEIDGVRYREWPRHVNIPVSNNYLKVFYIQAACMFCSKKFIEDVPIDPEIDFFAEEIILSIRAFSKGYPIYAFKSPEIYHIYARDRKLARINKSPFIDGNPSIKIMYDMNRSNAVIRGEVTDIYGLSKEEIDNFCKATGYLIELDDE